MGFSKIHWKINWKISWLIDRSERIDKQPSKCLEKFWEKFCIEASVNQIEINFAYHLWENVYSTCRFSLVTTHLCAEFIFISFCFKLKFLRKMPSPIIMKVLMPILLRSILPRVGRNLMQTRSKSMMLQKVSGAFRWAGRYWRMEWNPFHHRKTVVMVGQLKHI